MLTVFQVSFFVGIGLVLISFIFGQLLDLTAFDGLDFELFGLDILLPLSPMVYVLFSVVFGGTGWILMDLFPFLGIIPIVLISFATAFVISAGFYKGIVRPLKNAQNTSTPNHEELIGIVATVTETIYPKGFGEITYVIHGNSYKSPARTTTEEELSKGSEAAICWIEDNIFYVSNINTY